MPKSRTTSRARQASAARAARAKRRRSSARLAAWLAEVVDFREQISAEEWAQLVNVRDDPRAGSVDGDLMVMIERIQERMSADSIGAARR